MVVTSVNDVASGAKFPLHPLYRPGGGVEMTGENGIGNKQKMPSDASATAANGLCTITRLFA